jgi:cell division protein FtsB
MMETNLFLVIAVFLVLFGFGFYFGKDKSK